jgi:energy-coupling factor transport system substrate-specific component
MTETGSKSKSLKGSDLITIGIFTAIYFVVSFIPNMLGGLHPVLSIFNPVLAAILGATPFMILAARVKKPFAILIMGGIIALIWFMTGMMPITLPLLFVVGSIIAEIIRAATKYDNFWADAVGFSFFSFGMAGSPIALWLFTAEFMQLMEDFGIPVEFVTALTSMITPTMFVIMLASTFVAGLIGAFIAKMLFKKHFSKAGLV